MSQMLVYCTHIDTQLILTISTSLQSPPSLILTYTFILIIIDLVPEHKRLDLIHSPLILSSFIHGVQYSVGIDTVKCTYAYTDVKVFHIP